MSVYRANPYIGTLSGEAAAPYTTSGGQIYTKGQALKMATFGPDGQMLPPGRVAQDGRTYYPKTSDRREEKKPQSGLVGTAIRRGAPQAGGYIAGQIAGGEPTVTGTDSSGNTTYSDGGVTAPDGKVITPGSYASSVRTGVADVSAAIQLYDAIRARDTRGRVLGAAGAANTAAVGNDLYGSGIGAGVGGAIAGASILTSNGTPEQKATATRKAVEDGFGNYFTGGAWGLAQMADRKVLGGQTDKIRTKLDNTPVIGTGQKFGDKLTAKAFGLFEGKSKDQMRRDALRQIGVSSGYLTPEYGMTLADGSQYNIAADGGYRTPDGRRGFELDQSLSVDANGAPTTQGRAIAYSDPLAEIMAGGDQKGREDMAGYITRGVTSNAGDLKGVQANARAQYANAGFTDPKQIFEQINALEEAGKIDSGRAAAYRNSINDLYGIGGPAPVQQQQRREVISDDDGGDGGDDKKPKKPKKPRAPIDPSQVIPHLSTPTAPPMVDDEQTDEERDAVAGYRQMAENFAQGRR